MKKLIILLLLLSLPMVSFGAEIAGKTGQWIDLPVAVPEGKIGGGDFYTVDVTLAEGDNRPFDFKETNTGASFKFSQSGKYRIHLTINHVTKSSCAAVSVTPHRKIHIYMGITP